MENDAADFLKRVVKTLSMALLWLFLNTTVGIYMGWMFYNDAPKSGNFVFYGWMIISLSLLLYYFYRVWKKKR
jgi:hypothetical protein